MRIALLLLAAFGFARADDPAALYAEGKDEAALAACDAALAAKPMPHTTQAASRHACWWPAGSANAMPTRA